MLVLSRKPGECIRVVVPPSDEPTTIVVALVTCNTSRSRIGFLAASEVEVLRSELVEPERPLVAEAVTAL